MSFYHNRSSKEPGEEMKKRQISNPKQQRIDFNHQDLEKMIVKKHKSKLAFFYLQAIQIQFGDYTAEMRNYGFHNFLSVLGLSDGEIDGKQKWGREKSLACTHGQISREISTY